MSVAALEAPGVTLSANHLISLRHVALASETSAVLAALPGGFATRRKGRGLEVADVREYVRGDDLRHLDRGATARTGRLHVRQFLEDRDRILLLIADFRPSMFWGISRAFRSVAAAEALALIGWTVVERGGRVGLLALTPDQPVIAAPRGRVRGMLDVIGGLVEAHHTGLGLMAARAHGEEQALDGAMAQAERLAPAGAEVILASGFDKPGQALGDRLGRLASRRTPRLLLITDAESERLPDGHYPISLPDGRRARVYLGRGQARKTGGDDRIAGWPVLRLDAGDPVRETAGRIAEAFRTEGLP
ncbi:MAG: DUF58 domain-containing protein [Pseudomonadota bacterium]